MPQPVRPLQCDPLPCPHRKAERIADSPRPICDADVPQLCEPLCIKRKLDELQFLPPLQVFQEQLFLLQRGFAPLLDGLGAAPSCAPLLLPDRSGNYPAGPQARCPIFRASALPAHWVFSRAVSCRRAISRRSFSFFRCSKASCRSRFSIHVEKFPLQT